MIKLKEKKKKKIEKTCKGKIYISQNDVFKNIRIINSYESLMGSNEKKIIEELKNEEQIKECEITIDGKIIPFSYFYQFEKEGEYQIKYNFKNNLKNTNHMFYGCDKLIYLNLSKINTKEVINMDKMFYNCVKLEELNLSSFNAPKLKSMEKMFYNCLSLTKLDLSNFMTKSNINMKQIFFNCNSLVADELITNDQSLKSEIKRLNKLYGNK